MVKTTLEIRYKRVGGVSISLDHAIQRFFEDLGFEFAGRGFNYETGIRDIQFEKEQKD